LVVSGLLYHRCTKRQDKRAHFWRRAARSAALGLGRCGRRHRGREGRQSELEPVHLGAHEVGGWSGC